MCLFKPHDVDHVIPKKVKKEMQLQLKKEQSSERLQESSVPPENVSSTSKTPSCGKNATTPQIKIANLETILKKIKNLKKDAAKKQASEQLLKTTNHENSNNLNIKSKAESNVHKSTAKKVVKGRKGRKAKKSAKTNIKIARKLPEKIVKKKAGRKKKLRENENTEINQQ